ncbi:MAG: hypothetical protein ABIG92_06245 [Candidatus Omnitrophota bacterium]
MFKNIISSIGKTGIYIAIGIFLLVLTLSNLILNSRYTRGNVKNKNSAEELMIRLDKALKRVEEKRKGSKDVSLDSKKSNFLTLEGISFRGILDSNDEKLALVNDRIIRPGDEILGFTLVGIEEKSLTFKSIDGEEKTIYLYEE